MEQPKASEIYYNNCASIDQHNRHRQDTLKLETKVETNSWDKRVNTTLFGMCVVDTWLAWSQVNSNNVSTQSDFYRDLAEELIDNNFDRLGTPRKAGRHASSPNNLVDSRTGHPRAGVAAHLTPTKKKRKKKNGEVTNHAKQGYCAICRRKTKYMCSLCYDENGDGGDHDQEIYLCGNETGRTCFQTHLDNTHGQ